MPSSRPHASRRAHRAVVAASLLASAVAALLGGFAPSAAASGAPRFDARERAVLARVNAVRADHGLDRLAAGGRLARAADRHSRRQQRSRTISHRLPGESTLMRRLARAARERPVGEVVLYASRGTSSARIVRAWMDSPGHRAVLLSASFGRAGVGIRSGAGGVFATMDVAAR